MRAKRHESLDKKEKERWRKMTKTKNISDIYTVEDTERKECKELEISYHPSGVENPGVAFW